MSDRIEFYRLSRKFVDRRKAPAQSEHLIHYTLAVGHHIGVLDCFTRIMSLDRSGYAGWLSSMAPGDGRSKLEGVLKWGEIEINSSHVGVLTKSLNDALPSMQPQKQEWTHELLEVLRLIMQDPMIYLVVRVA